MAKSGKVARFLKKAKKKAPKAERTPRSNPSTTALMELGTTIGAGAGAYAANRLGTALIVKVLGSRLGAIGKHLSPMASLGLAALIWFVAERWAALRRYGTSIIVGSGIAVVQTILNRYLPGIEVLLNSASVPLSLPKATGEYIEDDDDDYSLPGQQLARPALAPPDDESDDLLTSTGIFSGSV